MKVEQKDAAALAVISSHLQLQREGFLSTWTNSFVGPWDPSQGLHNPGMVLCGYSPTLLYMYTYIHTYTYIQIYYFYIFSRGKNCTTYAILKHLETLITASV